MILYWVAEILEHGCKHFVRNGVFSAVICSYRTVGWSYGVAAVWIGLGNAFVESWPGRLVTGQGP